MSQDLYDILGVSRTASADDIRRAHRKLVREFHPDVNKAADATSKFAGIQEAYDILSDPDKRERYDRFGMAGVKAGAGGAPGGHPGAGGTGDAHGGDPFGGGPFGGQGNWQSVDPGTFEEIFGSMFGGGGRGAQGKSRRHTAGSHGPEQGANVQVTETIDFTTAARGGTRSFRLGHTDQTVEVKIPAGVQDGARLAVRGKGSAGEHGGAAGDLIITVRVAAHPWLTRDGNDLLMDVPLSLAEAALGTTLKVPLLDGSVTMKVPPGVRSGQRLRVKGKGIGPAKGAAGDFFAVLQIAAPKDLTAAQRDAFEELARTLPTPRTGAPWGE